MTNNILTITADLDENGVMDCKLKAHGNNEQVAIAVASILTEIGKADINVLNMILKIHSDDFTKYVKEKLENE